MSALRRLRRAQDGSGTIEFALLAPLFIGLFLSTFELGMLLTRQMMLDRALDIAVREVRLGRLSGDVHQGIKDIVCARARVIPKCDLRLTLAMTVVDPRAWNGVEPPVRCRDRDEDEPPANEFRRVQRAHDPARLRRLQARHAAQRPGLRARRRRQRDLRAGGGVGLRGRAQLEPS